jgi:thiamine biosynthesis lipoprotein
MACEFSVTFPGGFRRAVDAGCAGLDEVDRLEAKLSAYETGSDLSCLNRMAFDRAVPVDAEVFEVLSLAARLTEATGGAFDAATGALIKAWGFYAGPKRVPGEAELAAALAASGMAHVRLENRTVRYLRAGLEINLGSIGKGYAIDRAARAVATGSALIEGGRSSLRAIGRPPGEPRGWQVAIGDPFRPGRALGSIWLKDRALGTSGSAHQFFVHNGRRYGHILDPRTGRPAEGLASASAAAPTAAEADALSTAFFVLGVDATRRHCREHPEIGAVLVTQPGADGRAQVVVTGDIQMERI